MHERLIFDAKYINDIISYHTRNKVQYTQNCVKKNNYNVQFV